MPHCIAIAAAHPPRTRAYQQGTRHTLTAALCLGGPLSHVSRPTHGTAGPFSRLSHNSWWWPVVQTNWRQAAAALHANQPSRPSFAAKKQPTESQAQETATAGQPDGIPTVPLKAPWPVQTNQTQSGCNSIESGCNSNGPRVYSGGQYIGRAAIAARHRHAARQSYNTHTHTVVVLTAHAEP